MEARGQFRLSAERGRQRHALDESAPAETDAVVIATEWKHFRALELDRDGAPSRYYMRNIYH
jgi:hypothetical protein